MKHSNANVIFSLLLIAAGFAVVAFLSSFVEQRRVKVPAGYEDTDLALEGKRLKGWALGTEGLLADWYWMSSLQYIGGKIVRSEAETINLEDLRPLNPRLLYPLLDNATDLDPRFMAAYSYGASVLPAVDPSLAIKLTEKGIANNPSAWRLYQYLGYIYWRLKMYEKAAETYEAGSRIAGSGTFMRQMAAAMQTEGGSRDTARAIYTQILAEAEDQSSRDNAQLRLLELDSLEEREAVNKLLDDHKRKNGTCIDRVSEIFGVLRELRSPKVRNIRIDKNNQLIDPAGTPYRLDNERCTLELGTGSPIPRSVPNQ